MFSFALMDSTTNNVGRAKNFKRYADWIIPAQQLDRTIRTIVESRIEAELDLQSGKNEAMETYIQDEQYRTDFLERLRPEIQKGLSFVHDYKQINAQIAQNINVVIETRYPGADLEEKLTRATHAERAIYWASKFLQEKLNVARLLLHPEWITKDSEKNLFRFHGQVTKYLRIYQYMFDEKQLRVSSLGRSFGNVYGNTDAVGVIPHTLFDNALKYSPVGEKVEIYLNDEQAGIDFSVSSYGPKIEERERETIFRAFVRGVHAEASGEEGAGYGLYVAQLVAAALKTQITVTQDQNRRKDDRYWTTFSVILPCA